MPPSPRALRRVVGFTATALAASALTPLLPTGLVPAAAAAPVLCASPTRDGDVTGLTGVVNTYYPGTASAAAGATSITLGAAVGSTTPIANGDLLLVVQMQDAQINSNNSSSYGANNGTGRGWTALNNSGRYEYVKATAAVPVTGGTLQLTGLGTGGGLVNAYANANASSSRGQRRFQVIRVPQYRSVTVGAGLTAQPWNGRTGGMLVMDVAGKFDIGANTVDVSSRGFRGGGGRALQGDNNLANTDYRSSSGRDGHGSKGEGVAGTPRYVYDPLGDTVIDNTTEGYPNGSYARGAPGNAGGGGTDGNPSANDQNSGGGGGGNGGIGGQGGNSWFSNLGTGGVGGAAVVPTITSLSPGGGGGAGTRNNSGTTAGSGGAGGGAVLVRVGSATGTGGSVVANGTTAPNLTENDGAGGGGAGGSVSITATGTLSGFSITAAGGAGANSWPTQPPTGFPGERHGPGGGGAGGAVVTTATAITRSVPGGAHGTSTTAQDAYGSTDGASGLVLTTVTPTDVPGASSGAECSTDLSVGITGPANVSSGAATISYGVALTAGGSLPAAGPSWTVTTPAGTTFSSVSVPAGWSCTTPAVGATGTITCSSASAIAVGSTISATLVLNRTAASGTVTVTANGTSTTPDAALGNNSASTTATIWPPPVAAGDAWSVGSGGSLTVPAPGVLGNDSGFSLQSSLATGPAHGSATVGADGSVSYSSTAGYSGTDQFTYTLTDGFGRTTTSTVTVTVLPVAVADAYVAASGVALTVPAPGLLQNDLGTGLTVTGSTSPTHGTLTANTNGSFTYTPSSTYAGPDSFSYTVTDASGATATATVNLTVNPLVSVNSVAVTEGNSGTTTATFTVSLSAASASTVTVDWATADGSATTASGDYAPGSGTVTFLAGETSKPVAVTVNGDTTFEGDETFTVGLTNPSGASVGTSPGTGTITNDDGVPSVSVNSVSVTEGNSGTTTATFTVSLSNPSAFAVSVDWTTADGTASAGSDYGAGSGTVTFLPGQTSKTVSVTVNGDTLFEGDETFTVGLSNPSGASVGTSPGTGTITNDDTAPSVSVDSVSVMEGNSGTTTATFTVSLSAASGLPVSVDWATADGTASAGSDYGAGSGTVTFLPGQTSKTVSVTVNGDTMFEGNETFTVALSNPAGASIGTSPGTGTILNDDVQPSVSVNSTSVTEGNSGTASATFTVSLSNPSASTVTVNWATADGTAKAGASAATWGNDYVAGSGTVTFLPGETSKSVVVTVNGDVRYEPDETFTVGLSGPSGATVGTSPGTGTILTDDETIYVDTTADVVDATPGDHYCRTAGDVCSFRAAVQESNSRGGVQPIVLQTGALYRLTVAGAGEDASATGDLDVLDNTTITGNGSTLDAAGIDRAMYVAIAGGSFSIDHLTIRGGNPPGPAPNNIGAGMLTVGGVAITLDTVTVTGNTSGYAGGGLLTTNTGGVVLRSSTISNNSAVAGGGMASLSPLTVTDSVFSGNTGTQVGGGLLTQADASLTNVEFTGNSTDTGGAGIFHQSGMFTMVGGSVHDNAANGVGGGMALTDSASLTDVVVERNTAAFAGGICQVLGTLTMTRGRVADNHTTQTAGGLLLESNASLTDVVVEQNTGLDGAGAIVLLGTVSVTGGAWRNNTASRNGGGLVEWSGSVTMNGVSVTGNSAQMGGGLILTGAASVSNSTVSSNSASLRGGGVFLGGTDAISITGSTISGNTSPDSGAVFAAGTGPITMSTSEIAGNTSTGATGLGPVSLLSGSLTVSRSTLAGNSGYLGGALLAQGAVTMDRSTISGNSSAIAAVMVLASSGGTVTMRDSTVTANTGPGFWSDARTGVTLRNSIVAANSSISCIGAVTSNGYNLASDSTCGLSQPTDVSNTAPNLGALANNGGPTRTHLPNAASPAVNTGDPACLPTDQRGNARPNGAACDRGAVER